MNKWKLFIWTIGCLAYWLFFPMWNRFDRFYFIIHSPIGLHCEFFTKVEKSFHKVTCRSLNMSFKWIDLELLFRVFVAVEDENENLDSNEIRWSSENQGETDGMRQQTICPYPIKNRESFGLQMCCRQNAFPPHVFIIESWNFP